jgi:hypothetical protein
MNVAVLLFGLLSLAFLLAGLSVYGASKSAIHEIEAIELLFVSSLFGVGSVLAHKLDRLPHELAEELRRIMAPATGDPQA